jgi:hypothetical protein
MAVPSIAHSADVLNCRRQSVPAAPAQRQPPGTPAIEAWCPPVAVNAAGRRRHSETQDTASMWPKASAVNRLARVGLRTPRTDGSGHPLHD